MLMSDRGVVGINGRKLDLMAEFSQLVNKLIECDAFDKDDIDMCIRFAYLSDEERKDIDCILKMFE